MFQRYAWSLTHGVMQLAALVSLPYYEHRAITPRLAHSIPFGGGADAGVSGGDNTTRAFSTDRHSDDSLERGDTT